MAWIAENRQRYEPASDEPAFTAELQSFIRDNYFPRYPTKRACLLPALHAVQHKYNWIPPRALAEIGAFLELAPAEVMDTATFYEEYWLKPKGKYLVQVCRSLTCEICQSSKLTDAVREKYNVEPGETTADGRITLVELECLGACGTAPIAMINDVIHENVDVPALMKEIEGLPADPHDYNDPVVTWDTHGGH